LSLCFGGNFDFGDYNNDGYFDLLIADNGHTLLFENNNGVFSQTNETFEEVTQGTGIFGDYDNDGDLDIFITGDGFSKLYINSVNNYIAIDSTLTD